MASEDDARAMFVARTSEIQWRGAQRDGIALAALLTVGTMINYRVGLFCPVILYFLASMWHAHDKRIGSVARFLRTEIEPLLKDVPPYEPALDASDPDRSYNRRWSRSAVTARLYFPVLQLGTLAQGVWQYATLPRHPISMTVGVAVLAILELALVVYTFKVIKHVRVK